MKLEMRVHSALPSLEGVLALGYCRSSLALQVVFTISVIDSMLVKSIGRIAWRRINRGDSCRLILICEHVVFHAEGVLLRLVVVASEAEAAESDRQLRGGLRPIEKFV